MGRISGKFEEADGIGEQYGSVGLGVQDLEQP
jgi:hypothetical protein